MARRRTTQTSNSTAGPSNDALGAVVWFEIPVRNLQRGAEFYGALFRWSFQPFDDYDPNYWLIRNREGGVGGALIKAEAGNSASTGTVIFVQVPALCEWVAKAKGVGARVITPLTRITEQAGLFAIIEDPDGNPIGLWSAAA